MTNKSLSQLDVEDTRLQLRLAIWGVMIVFVGIYIIGIISSNKKAVWIKPTCSVLTLIAVTSTSGLRRIAEVNECTRQDDKDILMQARRDALYQSSNLPIVRSALKQADI